MSTDSIQRSRRQSFGHIEGVLFYLKKTNLRRTTVWLGFSNKNFSDAPKENNKTHNNIYGFIFLRIGFLTRIKLLQI